MPVVDDDVLQQFAALGASSAFMLELIDWFARDAHGALERMRACAQAGETSLLGREAHRLKGSSGTMGAVALARECIEIERCACAGTCAGLEARVETALALLELTRGHITEFFRGNIATAV